MKQNGNANLDISKGLKTAFCINNGKKTTVEKIDKIESYFIKIMEVLNLDLNDSSLKDTPRRIAKMYVEEIFKGLDSKQFPKVSFFENTYGYDEMIIVKDITLYSYCEHHFVPFIGKVHIAYYAHDKVIGLSKLNRVVQFIASKPQVQEKLTVEIGTILMSLLETKDMAVHITADHLCVSSRGIKDVQSCTKTFFHKGRFKNTEIQKQFYNSLV